MDLRDIPAIQQAIAAVAQLYAAYVVPCARALGAPAPAAPNRRYTLLLLGGQNAGKSSFINHCIGQPLLRTGHGRTTERLCFVLPGADRQSLTVAQARDSFPEIADLVLADGAAADVEVYPGMRAFAPSGSAYLSRLSGVLGAHTQVQAPASPFFFIDTPGVTDATDFGLLGRLALAADQVLLFGDCGGLQLTAQTCAFLQLMAQRGALGRVSVVLSKADLLDSKFQAVQAIANCVQVVHRAVPFADFRVYPVSLPRFLAARTRVQHDANRAQPQFEQSRLQLSLGSDGPAAQPPNEEPFLAAQFDLLAELENALVDRLQERLTALLDAYARDVRELGTRLEAYEGEAARRRRANASLVALRLVAAGALLSAAVAAALGPAALRPRRVGAAAALAAALCLLLVPRRRPVLPVHRLVEMGAVVEDVLMKTVRQLEQAE